MKRFIFYSKIKISNLKMDNIELEDLVYTYPEYGNPRIQTEISEKEEFQEIRATVSERVPRPGELYSHQKFLKRLMLQYDQQLVMWGAGLGKTCGYVAVTEHYKAIASVLEEIRKESQVENGLYPPYKRVYILVKGQNLIDETKHQILCKCTDGDYITEQIINSKTEMARKANVTRSISKYYTITTYGDFANTVFNMTDQQLRIEFDNSIFIVDEVHNINDDKSGGFIRRNDIGNPYYAYMKKKKEKIMKGRLIYDQLWRLFHLVKPRKVMLLSATPMINDASEIGPKMNLILPAEMQIGNIDWDTVKIDELEPYFRGLISYVRALDTGAIPVYQGLPINAEYTVNGKLVKAEIVVYATEMAEKQAAVYEIAVKDPHALRPESDRPEAFDDLKRQVANFVFPDNSTGSVGFSRYVEEGKGGYKANEELGRWLSSPEHFRALSAKFFEIVRLCKEEPGNCWCYSNYIKGSGGIVLGECFRFSNFERFNESSSVFSLAGGNSLSTVCGGKSLDDVDVKKDRVVRIGKKLRYALLTSDTSGPESTTLLELFNSYENRHGEYIKAVVGSPVTRDGLNLANVLQIHLVEAGWNQASTYQAESRAIRSTSHVDLLDEERIRSGRDDVSIVIKVYRHAAITELGQGIDIEHYELSEKKDREIKRIVRMMKIIATDCHINYARNVREKDVDYTSTCDYDICEYKCFSDLGDEIDYTSYDVLYSAGVIEEAKSEIIDIFRVIFQIDYETLYSELSHFRRKFIDLAVTDLIEKKTIIYNRYGYKSYLREDKNFLFLRTDYSLNNFQEGGLSLTEYSSFLIGKETITLEMYNGRRQREELNLSSEVFNDDEIDDLTLENRILLLESAMQSYYIDKNENLEERNVFIINKFRNYIYIEYEPRRALEYVTKAMSERGKGRGRKPREGTKFKLTERQVNELDKILGEKDKKEVIYFHNLSVTGQAQTSYAMTAKFKKSEGEIRLLKPSETVNWRTANDIEDIVYNEIIRQKSVGEKVEHEIYGLILADSHFRIVDQSSEDVEKSSKDRRKVNRGRICHTFQKWALIELLWKLEFNPFNIDVPLFREELISFLSDIPDVENFSDEKLEFFYTWSSSGSSKQRICSLLQDFLESENKLIRY
jgi:hypothetical protein